MTNQQTAREFWIKGHPVGKNISGTIDVYTAVAELPQNEGWLHVIEYSVVVKCAAEILKQECEIANLQKENARLVAELEEQKQLFTAREAYHNGDYTTLTAANEKLRAELSTAVEALEHLKQLRDLKDRSGGYYGCTCKDDVEEILNYDDKFITKNWIEEALAKIRRSK